MSEKKFLDKNGTTIFWRKITDYILNQNFADNDSLAAVVDAVDQVKLDVYDFITNEEIDRICS